MNIFPNTSYTHRHQFRYFLFELFYFYEHADARVCFKRFITQQNIDCQNKDDRVTFSMSRCAWIYSVDNEDGEELEEGVKEKPP